MPRLEYWLQLENHPWDLAPNGIDRATGASLRRDANGMFRPLGHEALIIRRYTANWAAPDDQPLNRWDITEVAPAQLPGTIPGATIEAKVGDEIIVHYRNHDQRVGLSDAARMHSLHAHGVQVSAVHDGTYPFSPPDPAQGNRRGDRIPPGESFDYRYTVGHVANAGVWLYQDGSMRARESLGLGAFGAIVVRAGGEMRPNLPTQLVRGATDTAIQFASLPNPPASGEHLVVIHELSGAGECVNGRQLLGNTPALLARVNSRVKLRVLNATTRSQAFHLHGHRWRKGDDWTDVARLAAGEGTTFEVLEGSSENGGGNGEWGMSGGDPSGWLCSLVVTSGGAMQLEVGTRLMNP